MNLSEAHASASDLYPLRFNEEAPAYPTQRNAKRDLISTGFITQVRKGKHFMLTCTDKGDAAVQEIIDNESWGTAPVAFGLSSIVNRRVGKGHLLPRADYAALMKNVNAGAYDLIVIERDKVTKMKYWDEA